MAHNIQNRDIQTGIKQAWHGLTNIVESVTRENSGIDYDMDTVPLYIKLPDGSEVETDHRQIISLDDNLPVGKPVSETYCVISNTRIWDMIESALSGTKHEVVSVGTVADRSKGFISVKLDESFTAASRATEPFLNLLWGHGGNISLMARTGFIVTVCENTFNANMGRRGGDLSLSIKHSLNALGRVEDMAKAIDAYCGVVAEFKQAMNTLESVACDEENARKIFHGVLAPDTFEKNLTVSTRQRNTVDRLISLYATGRGNTGSNLADVFNASTDYFTHESSGGKDLMKQFVSSEFGAGNNQKAMFYDMLTNEETLRDTTTRGEKVMMAMTASN